jgi:hypothetical protein
MVIGAMVPEMVSSRFVPHSLTSMSHCDSQTRDILIAQGASYLPAERHRARGSVDYDVTVFTCAATSVLQP